MQPRDEHTAVLDETSASMVIFGGFQGGERVNEVAFYNLKTNVWQKVVYANEALVPSARSGHSAVAHQGHMYVFGGKSDKSVKLNDLWQFNLQTHTWKRASVVDDVQPEVRSGHSSCVYDNMIIVFGGIYEVTKELNDCYGYSLTEKRWIALC